MVGYMQLLLFKMYELEIFNVFFFSKICSPILFRLLNQFEGSFCKGTCCFEKCDKEVFDSACNTALSPVTNKIYFCMLYVRAIS